MARLILRHEGGEAEYLIRGVVMIGRQATNDIPVMDDKASRHHARVVPEGNQFFVEDLASSNGTLLNGTSVERTCLKHGDVIRIGKARLMFYEDRSSDLEGENLAGYQIHRKIGQGGTGTVYKATQISMDRTVALKLLNEDLTRDRDFLESFLEEARKAAKLSHPNIVRVHDFGEAAPTYYFSMEFVDGESLDAVLRRDGKLPASRALEIARQIAQALDYAHAQDVCHRDIKPQNILVDRDGKALLTDIGLAKPAKIDPSLGATPSGRAHPAGTPDYMPPEIAEQRSVDSRADIYELGATLFHMVTGRPPYEGADAVAVIAKHVKDPVPSPKQYDSTIPDSVCRLIETTMSKNPAMRPSPAGVLVEKIGEILKEIDAGSPAAAGSLSPAAAAPVPPKPTAPVTRKPKSTRRERRRVLKVPPGSPATYALMGALAVAIIAVVAFVFMGRGGGRRSAKPQGGPHARRSSSVRPPLRSGGGKPGRRSGSEVYVDPAAAARAEQRAAKHLADIEKQLAKNPSSKQFVGRSLYRLISDYPQTEAAAKARRMYRDLFGDRADGLLNSLGPGPSRDEAPAGPIDENEAQEAFNKARLASLEAEADGNFPVAHRALSTFVARYRGSRREAEARELLERLGRRVHRDLDRLYKRAEAAAERGDFRRAGQVLREIIAKDPVGPDRKRARQLLRSNDTAAAAMYEQALADAAPHFRAFAFKKAVHALKRAEPQLDGTSCEKQLATAIDAADLAGAFLRRCGGKFARLRLSPPVFKRKGEPGRTKALAVVGVSPGGLLVREGGAEHALRWAELTGEEIVSVFELVPLAPVDRLALGAILSGRGSWLLARRQLDKAATDPVLGDRVEKLLAQVDRGMKTEKFDFSHFEQGTAWRTAGDTRWSVRDGVFIHEGAGVGTATLKTRTYRAVGFFISFTITFLDEIGAIEVQLGPLGSGEADSIWFSLGSSGYEARCSAGGQTAEARGEWRMMPRARHKIASLMTEGKLAVSVDGKALPPLKASDLGRIKGHLTFRVQGARLEIDDVVVRQIR